MTQVLKRVFYYIMLALSFCSRALRNRNLTMRLAMAAYRSQGVVFCGMPRYIHPDAYLDGSGGLYIGERVVVSTKVIVLTHDYSVNVRQMANPTLFCIDNLPKEDAGIFESVRIGDWSFLGAGCIVLPGSTIGKYCIIGAGAVVKGNIPDYSVVAGNPVKIIKRTC